jgi:hypothetical protein
MDEPKVMDEKTLRTDSSVYNQGTMMKQQIHEEINSAVNYRLITERIAAGTARDVSQELKKAKEPALIIGSGPSLDNALPLLKDWKGGIFCSTSHALSLMRFGVEPTHIVALDPFCRWEELEGVDWSKTKTKLIAHPGVWPDLLSNWPNDILLYIENMGHQNPFYGTQKRMYSYRVVGENKDYRNPTFVFYIPTEITLFACSPPIQIFFADLLGYGHSFLVGVDFCYSDTKERFTNWTMKDGEWVAHEHPFVSEPDLVRTSNGKFTKAVHLYYKKNFLTAWRLSKQTVYTTDQGAITELPYIDIQKVVRKQGRGFDTQTEEFVANHSEKYLAGVGAFVVETRNGLSFVESHDPARELTRYMADLTNFYTCDTCKVTVKAETPGDHSGETCPQCKQGKLKSSYTIDVQKNIKKFQRLLEYNDIKVDRDDWIPEPRKPMPITGVQSSLK